MFLNVRISLYKSVLVCFIVYAFINLYVCVSVCVPQHALVRVYFCVSLCAYMRCVFLLSVFQCKCYNFTKVQCTSAYVPYVPLCIFVFTFSINGKVLSILAK